MIEFSDLITALQNPQIYPHPPLKIEFIQTHISAVFLTGEHVYKIKKPVNFGFLDFTTLEKRKFYCHQEVLLNRRLSPEIYLGVVEIRWHEGRIHIGSGPGEIVEYAVLMKQLPAGCLMDQRLSQKTVTEEDLRKIASKIVSFHLHAATDPRISSFGGIDTIRGNLEENFKQTEPYVGRALPVEIHQKIRKESLQFLLRRSDLFQQRITEGKIRDCHGDLHLQHICLAEEILIFDCIEFNERFRYSDVAADIAFLLMDLDFHGYPREGTEVAAFYLSFSHDWSLFLLLDFYKSYRAYIRAKVTCFRLDDSHILGEEKTSALEEARKYFQLALLYAKRMNRPQLLVTGGLVGTGKTTIAQALAKTLGWEWVSTDRVRKELAHLQPQERRLEKFHQGIYAPDFSRQTYQALRERAGDLLGAGKSVVLDGSFKKEAERKEVLALSVQFQAALLFIECQCSEPLIRKRLAQRTLDPKEASDGRWEIFADQKKDYEPVQVVPYELHLRLNTEDAVEECLERIFHRLLQRAGEEIMKPQEAVTKGSAEP
jgi:aminoglycoside phosphotransferase family enzyme/predicted kinase